MVSGGKSGFARYLRQINFPLWADEGQEKLGQAKVAVVGCGGLGCVVGTHLARAGIGHLRLIDSDRVSLDNLHRQILYTEQDVESGRFKAEIAAERLRQANSSVCVEGIVARLLKQNADDLLGDVDIVVDATDNFESRFLINELAVRRGVPWVYGGVSGASGMTMTVVPGCSPCLRCLFPTAGSDSAGTGTATATPAVINTVVAVVASLQCTEVYKLILDPSSVRRGLLTLDLWDPSGWYVVEVERDPECPICSRL